MDSPFTYILITLFLSSIMLSIIFFMAWYSMGKKKYALVFSISFMISTVLWVINLAKDLFGSHDVYWIFATTFSVVSVIAGTYGHGLRTGHNINPKYLIAVVLFSIVCTYYFTVIEPHMGIRMSLYLFIDVIFLSISGLVILLHRKNSRPAEIGASVVHFIFALSLFVAASIALSQGRLPDLELIKLYAEVNFTTLPSAYVGMSVFVTYMLASDLAEEMKDLSMTDSLTNCLNRRGFYEKSIQQLQEFKSQSQHVCLIYWDIDKFKSINDQYGHAGGDQVLISTTQQLFQYIKADDLMGRMGGEEFVILIGRADYKDACHVAERLRELISNLKIEHKHQIIHVTASFGVVELNTDDVDIEKAIDLADAALFEAKNSGRNKVIFSQ